jgi:predicted nucleotidyltransferase
MNEEVDEDEPGQNREISTTGKVVVSITSRSARTLERRLRDGLMKAFAH